MGKTFTRLYLCAKPTVGSSPDLVFFKFLSQLQKPRIIRIVVLSNNNPFSCTGNSPCTNSICTYTKSSSFHRPLSISLPKYLYYYCNFFPLMVQIRAQAHQKPAPILISLQACTKGQTLSMASHVTFLRQIFFFFCQGLSYEVLRAGKWLGLLTVM